MTQNYHTPIPLDSPLNAAVFRSPDSDLDSAITDLDTRVDTVEADILTLASPDFADITGVYKTTTKGDIIVHNGTDNVRVPVGTNGFILTADSVDAEGLKWAAPAESGVNAAQVFMINSVFG